MALDTSHKYYEMLMQLVSFHGSVHIIDKAVWNVGVFNNVLN